MDWMLKRKGMLKNDTRSRKNGISNFGKNSKLNKFAIEQNEWSIQLNIDCFVSSVKSRQFVVSPFQCLVKRITAI